MKPDSPFDQPMPQKSGCGCWAWGCAITGCLFLVLLVGGGIGGYFFVKGQVTKYTAEAPVDLPVAEFTEEEAVAFDKRIETFNEKVDEGSKTKPLVLTAKELNSAISRMPELKGRIHVAIKDGKITGRVSFPTDGLPGGKGRFFNAEATFSATIAGGRLYVHIVDATVKGEKVPAEIMVGLKDENLAKEFNQKESNKQILRRFSSLRLEDDKLILVPSSGEEKEKGSGEKGNDEKRKQGKGEKGKEKKQEEGAGKDAKAQGKEGAGKDAKAQEKEKAKDGEKK